MRRQLVLAGTGKVRIIQDDNRACPARNDIALLATSPDFLDRGA